MPKHSSCLTVSVVYVVWFTLFASPVPAQPGTAISDTLTNIRYHIASITLEGNQKTRDRTILEDLTFADGDTLSLQDLDRHLSQSRINLINTALFLNHQVKLEYRLTPPTEIHIFISVKERWYLWPEPILQNAERNFNTWVQERNMAKLNYGIELIKENFRGRNERLTAVLRFGYDEKYEVTYQKPASGKSKTLGFAIGAGFSGNHEVAWKTEKDRLVFIRTDQYILTQQYLFAQLNLRPTLYHYHTFRLTASGYRSNDTLHKLNHTFTWNGAASFRQIDFQYLLKADRRDHAAYPLSGHYFDIEWMQFGVLSSVKRTGSFGFLRSNIRKYACITDHFYYAAGITGKVSTKKQQPFLFERGLGYGREFVRGYEYNVINGAHFILVKQNLKYALVPSRKIHVGFLPHEKFRDGWFAVYLNIFADGGYVSGSGQDDNTLVNRWIGGMGLGLDLVTYYDKVVRFEVAINDMGRTGLYVHFVAPI